MTGWIRFSSSHPWLILLMAALVTLSSIPFASRLHIDTDLRRLLPDRSPTVAAVDRAIGKMGDFRYFTLLIECDDPEASARYADTLAARLARNPAVGRVTYRRPVDFLDRNKFLLVPLPDLERSRDFILRQRIRSSPFHLGLGKKTAIPAGTEELPVDLLERYRALRDLNRYHRSEDGRLLGLQVRPAEPDTQVAKILELQRYLEGETAALRADGYPADLKVFISGSLRTKIDELGVIGGDLRDSGLVTALLVFAILWITFRSVRALGLILVPLVCGVTWSFGFTGAVLGYLNSISAMLFVALFGLGIDHGIHLLKATIQERAGGADLHRALCLAFGETGFAVVVSALTTTCGFLLLTAASFRGFRDLGLIAGSSMVLITLAFFLMLPALIVVGERTRICILPTRAGWSTLWPRIAGVLGGCRPGLATAACLGLILLGGAAVGMFRFNYDFGELRCEVADSAAARERQSRVYPGYITPGAILFAPDLPGLDRLLSAVADRKATPEGRRTIGRVVSLRDYFPADQEDRLAVIRDAARQITPRTLRQVEAPLARAVLVDLQQSEQLTPITRADLPPEITDALVTQDGQEELVLFVFPRIDKKKGREAIAFKDALAGLSLDGRPVQPAGDMLIFAEVLESSLTQGKWLMLASLAGMSGLLWLQFRGPRHMLRIMLSLLGGLGLMASLILILKVDINFANMVIFAAVVGMGVDTSVHLYTRWRSEATLRAGPQDPPELAWQRAVSAVGGPVTACTFTTMSGYLGMVISHHPALRTIAILAAVGLTSCYVVALFLYPMFLRSQEPTA